MNCQPRTTPERHPKEPRIAAYAPRRIRRTLGIQRKPGSGVHARRENLQSGASPRKDPLRSVRGTRTKRKRPVSSETHIDRKKPRNESQRHNLIKSKEMASIFSRIIAGEIPSYKVAEDENYYAFLDINPLTKGHTLVVPKQEVDYIFDLDDRTLAGMMVFAKQVAARIKREIACARVAVVVLGMEVPHAHIHLIPIQSENDVDFHREKLRLTPEEFREIAEKLAR